MSSLENCLLFDAIHDFSVWLRNGSKPPDINRFRRHTVKTVLIDKNYPFCRLQLVVKTFETPTNELTNHYSSPQSF